MSALNELRELDASLEGEEDIDNNGGPNTAMRVRQVLTEAMPALAELIEAARRANGDHTAPHDCYATGPLTGDPIRDLVSCPGCELAAALAKAQQS